MRLGPAELDAERCELRLEARRVRMEPRVFAVLAHLVRHAGRVVGREELIDAIWGSADVSDWAVARAVKEVRRVLARSGCGASIETVRGRGFALRLPAPVFPRGPPFVGRADVVAQLDEALVAAALGAGQIVLLEGEAGIGKTRTWLEFAPRARQRGARIAASRCDPLAATNPFWPWAQLLRAAAREEEAFAASLPDPDRSLLAQVFPGIAPPAAPAAPCDPGTPDQARLRLFEAVLCALGARGCDAPRVLWIDDLQWADADSLRLLAYVARGVATLPILLIAALRRPDGATAGEGGEAAGSILRAGARALRLRGLGRGEVEALWRALRADVPDAATLDRLLARTRGNPFFLVHLLRQDDPEHALAGRDGVRTAARDLLGGLSSEGTELLAMAAVAGAECDVNVLAGALERPPERVLAALVEAERAGLLEQAGEPPGRFRFRHDLIREVLVEDQPADARARLHGRVARALHARWGDDPEAPWGALAAHYLEAARAGHEAQPAVACAERAAERASMRFAYDEACAHLQRALEALALVQPPEPDRRVDLVLRLALTRLYTGEAESALATLDGVAPTVRALGRADLLARLALARELVGAAMGGEASNDPVSLALLREALAALPADCIRDGVRLRARLARRLFYARELEAAVVVAREACEQARTLGDDALEIEACAGLFWSLWEPAHLAERFELLERHRALAERSGSSREAVVARLLRCSCLAEAGAIGELDEALAGLEREAAAAPWVPVQTRWLIEHGRVLLLLLRGELREAETRILAALAGQGPAPRRADARAVLTGQLGLLRHFQGRAAETLPYTIAMAERLGRPWQALHAYAAVHAGRADEARRLLEEMAADGFRTLQGSVNWPALAAVAAEAAALLGCRNAAAALRPMLEPLREHHVFFRPLATPYGAGRRYLGLLDAVLGDAAAALEQLEEAQRLHERMGTRPWLAITSVDQAEILLLRGEAGDRDHAEQHLREAEEPARALGMQALLGRIEALAGRRDSAFRRRSRNARGRAS